MESVFDWKSEVYDVLGIEFVGLTAAMLYAHISTLRLPSMLSETGTIGLLFWLVTAYGIGHALRGLSGLLFGLFCKGPAERAWAFLSSGERQGILAGLRELYGFADVPVNRVEPLCIGAAQGRMSKRDVFLAVADYCRSMTLVVVLAGALLVARPAPGPSTSGCLLALGVLAFIFTHGYLTYSRYAALVAYGGFLAWWRIRKADEGGAEQQGVPPKRKAQ